MTLVSFVITTLHGFLVLREMCKVTREIVREFQMFLQSSLMGMDRSL